MARKSLGGPGRLKNKNARTAFTARHKLAVVASFDELGDVSAVIRKFYPNLACSRFDSRRKLIYQWRRDREALDRVCALPAQAEKKKARSLGVATVLSADDERVIVTWVNELRGFGVPITATMVQLKVLEVARASETASFTASTTWLKLFKNRHQFSMRARTRQGQSTPADANQVAIDFGKTVRQMASDLGVSKIYNADQTACSFEYIPTRTLTKTGEKTVWVRCGGKEKERMTVMLLADSDGVKYPPTVVYKSVSSQTPTVAKENRVQRNGFGVRLWKRMQKIQERTKMHVYGNKTAWWNSSLQLKFLTTFFGSRPDMSVPVLLLLDDFSGHWTQPVRDYAASVNVIMLKVPPGYTSVCQPADVCWMKPFKDQLRAQWTDFMREQIEERRDGEPFKMAAPGRENVADWIRTAWDRLSVKTVSAGYRTTHTAVGDENEAACFVVRELARLSLLNTTLGEIDSDNEFDE